MMEQKPKVYFDKLTFSIILNIVFGIGALILLFFVIIDPFVKADSDSISTGAMITWTFCGIGLLLYVVVFIIGYLIGKSEKH